MRDEAAQASGASGTPIRHAALIGFICRNYECDERGQWFFQNGPQRVYVELAYTPWIVRLARDAASGGALKLTDQTGGVFEPSSVFADDEGGILFTDASESEPVRVAALHDHDLDLFADSSTLSTDGLGGQFHWRVGVDLPLQTVLRAEVAARFGFVASPAAAKTSPAA